MSDPFEDALPIARPSLSVDWEVYAALLEESDLSPAQQQELIETLWSIVVMFVDMGFEVPPTRQFCGELEEPEPDDLPDVVCLFQRAITQSQLAEEE